MPEEPDRMQQLREINAAFPEWWVFIDGGSVGSTEPAFCARRLDAHSWIPNLAAPTPEELREMLEDASAFWLSGSPGDPR